jgi:hypothetical protein
MAKAKDGRVWIRVTTDMPDNKKFAGVSDHAFRMFFELLCWSKDQLTDGFIPDAVMRRKWKTDSVTDSDSEALTELLTNDPTNPSLIEVEGGYQIHDYAEHQETKADVLARSETNRNNGKRGGRPKKTDSVADSGRETKADDRRQTTEKDINPLFDPADADSNDGAAPQPSFTYPAAFEEFWSSYPRHSGKRKALAKWQEARKRAPEQIINAGAARYRDDPNRIDQFTQQAERWLAANGWEDDPLPRRDAAAGRPTTTERMLGWEAAAQEIEPPEYEYEQIGY